MIKRITAEAYLTGVGSIQWGWRIMFVPVAKAILSRSSPAARAQTATVMR